MANRTAFLHYRLGTGTEGAIAPAWLTIYGAAIGAAETVVDRIIQPVSGYFDCRRAADVVPGDILREGKTGSLGRVFIVTQIENRPATTRVLVTEIFPPIPDEFESGVREAFWAEDADWVVDKSFGAAQPTPLASLTSPSVGNFLYQTIEGNFDCYTRVAVDTGSGGAIRHALLKVQENLLGPDLVGVGLRNDGFPTFYRVDRVDPTVTTTDGRSFTSDFQAYLRLQRIGTRFRTFWAALLDGEPEKEEQWTEINAPSIGDWTTATTNPLLIGLCAYQNTGTAGIVRFHFFRNWRS